MNGIINAFTAWSRQFYSDMIHTAQAPNISNIHFSMDFDAQKTHFSIEKHGSKTHFSIIALRNARLAQLNSVRMASICSKAKSLSGFFVIWESDFPTEFT